MITLPIDRSIDLSKLEEAIQENHSKLIDSQAYFMREKYVDRGRNENPFYIIRFHEAVSSRYEDLLHEELYKTKTAGVAYKYICRDDPLDQPEYWKTASGNFIKQRLDNFMKMCKEYYLQAPGKRQGPYGKKILHKKFEAKPFEFELSSPWSTLIGFCPLSKAALADFGAIEGVLKDISPNELAKLELIIKNQKGDVFKRSLTEKGKFWFSKLPPGEYKLEMKEHVLNLTSGKKPFGWIKGKSKNDLDEYPGLCMEAPDKTIFKVQTDTGGNFHAHLPPFSYKLTIPGHWFKAKIWIKGNTIISGIVHNEAKEQLTGVEVLLQKEGSTIATQDTKSDGSFRFELSMAGKFNLEIPGYVLFAKKIAPATIKGRLSGDQPTQIELIVKEQVISKTTTSGNGQFEFNGLTAGDYQIRSTGNVFRIDKLHQLKGDIQGIIKDCYNKPLGIARVELRRTLDNYLILIETNQDGGFVQKGIPPGNYRLKVIGNISKISKQNIIDGLIHENL